MPKVVEAPTAAAKRKAVDPLADLLEHGRCPECFPRETITRICWCSRHGITPDLRAQAYPIDRLKFDPRNARLHPDENIVDIQLSLLKYGQMKAIAARRDTRVVMAGNGTMLAAQGLGWTHLAVTFADMTDTQAIGYALSDNKTAESSKWDIQVQAECALLYEQHEGEMPPGFRPRDRQSMYDLLRQGGFYDRNGTGSEPPSNLENVWNVLIQCETEEKQLALINEMMERGHSCRALTF